MKKYICLALLFLAAVLSGCGASDKMKDGFYTAEMSDFSHGWKEYLCIMVKDNTIVYAEFNAKDASGYIKAWDNAYMESMNASQGTYPNEYTRSYVSELIDAQTSGSVDTITGATSSGNNFRKLSEAVISQAKNGEANTIVVE